jgi:hypothetical protein
MKISMGRTGRAFAALAFVGTLGFGSVQAFADPAVRDTAERLCNNVTCNVQCTTSGYTAGKCDRLTGECVCIGIE